MFNLFKKHRNRLDEDVALIKTVCHLLPEQFRSLSNQVLEGIILSERIQNDPYLNYRQFKLDIQLLNKYEDKIGRCFIIKGILAYDNKSESFVEIYLDVAYGILIGFSTPLVSDINVDLAQIKVDKYYVQYYGEEDYDKLKTLLTHVELKLIAPADIYQIELKGKVYYHIRDLGDGDFIGIDSNKNVFKITHDPFEVIKINESLTEVLRTPFPERL